jgi:dipeptidyl aminopeptidase/acylaminoacyl peptidase
MRTRIPVVVALVALASAVIATGAARATYPGANGRLAFASDGAGDLDVYTVNADGSGLVNLTSAPGAPAFALEPDWSPGGGRITFRAGRANAGEIYTANADGSGIVRVTDDAFRDRFPAWSPDGTTIVFESNRSDPSYATCVDTGTCNTDIFAVPAGGGVPVQLTFDAGADSDPQLSPDGRFLAYDSDLGGAFAVYRLDLVTGEVTKLTVDGMEAGEPDWSPDGTQIAFVDNFACGVKKNLHGKGCKSDVFVMSADGSLVRQLTSGFGNNLGPSWSPQGDAIAFEHGNNLGLNRQRLYTIHPDGSGLRRLTHDNGNDITPDWGAR